MNEGNFNNTPGLAGDQYDRFLSLSQKLINFIFITSWIVMSVVVILAAIFMVVIPFIA